MSSRPNRLHAERACESCGCTDARACLGGCAWVEGLDGPLCSACAALVLVRQEFENTLAGGAVVRGSVKACEDLGGPRPRIRLRLELEAVIDVDDVGRLGELLDVRGPLTEALSAARRSS